MLAVKVVHCADVHLDASFIGTGLDNEAAKLRAEELKDSFASIVKLVRSEGADLFLIAGDLFEEQYVRKSTVQYIIDLIQTEIPMVPTFIAPGNHDPFTRQSYYATMTWPQNVTIFGPHWSRVRIPDKRVTVHGWGFDRPHVMERRLAELKIAPADELQIVVLHGSDDRYPTEEGVYLPFSQAECLNSGADYIALGHFHGYHVAAERNGPLAQYPGSPESLSFGQASHHGVLVGTVSKQSTAFRLIPVSLRQHISLEIDVTGVATLEQAVSLIDAAIPVDGRERNLYRLTLTGEVEVELDLSPALVEAKLLPNLYQVMVRNRTVPAWDLEALAAERSVRGRFTARLLAEIEKADPGEQEELGLALRFGIKALEGGR